jgi:hypothetical protein
MKRLKSLCVILIFLGLGINQAIADIPSIGNHAKVAEGDTPILTTYAVDSLYFYGSSGVTDNTFTTGELITVEAWLDITHGKEWKSSGPISAFYLIPWNNVDPASGSTTVVDRYGFGSGDASSITLSDPYSVGRNTKMVFTFIAPTSWTAGDLSVTLYLAGILQGLGANSENETYASGAGVTVVHSGTGTITDLGKTYATTDTDSTPPAYVSASCFATSLTTITLEFDETLVVSDSTVGLQFTARDDDDSNSRTGTTLVGSGTTYVLTLGSALSKRDWKGEVLYATGAESVEDAYSNELGTAVVDITIEEIDPGTVTYSTPAATTYLANGFTWSGTADSDVTDPSMASVEIQGSDDQISWTTVDTDSVTGDASYGGTIASGPVSWSYYRLLASDDQTPANTTASSLSSNFEAKQRLTASGTVSEQPNTYEDEITITITDAYGEAETGTHTISLTDVTSGGAGTVTFQETLVGDPVTTIDIESSSMGTFYMAADAVDDYTIRVNTAGLEYDDHPCTIVSGTANRIVVVMPGQTLNEGSSPGYSGVVTDKLAGEEFNISIYVMDANYYVVDYDATETISLSETDLGSSGGQHAQIKVGGGSYSTTWTGKTIDFENGVNNDVLAVKFYDVFDGATITADTGSVIAPNHAASAGINTTPAAANDMVWQLATATQENGTAWTGTNKVTIRDLYENVKTDFRASLTNVTVTATLGGGSVTSFTIGDADAILDEDTDFVSGVCNLTTLGSGTFLDVDTAGAWAITGDLGNDVLFNTKNIGINAPTLSSPTIADDDHVNTAFSQLLQASCDENGETLTVHWAYDNDGASPYDSEFSTSLATANDVISYNLPQATFVSQVEAGSPDYDYFFWWVTGSDAEGNPVEGTPVLGSEVRAFINPTLTVTGSAIGAGFGPSVSDKQITKVLLNTEMTGATITCTRVDFTKTSTSTATTTHVSGFKLWQDANANGTFEVGSDTQLGVEQTSTVNPSFTGLSFDVVAGTDVSLFLTISTTAAASVDQTLGMELTSDNVFVLNNAEDDVYPNGGDWPEPPYNAANDYTLPVEISLFEAIADYGYNSLNWRTESEENSLGFRVWRAETVEIGVFPALDEFSPVADWQSDAGLLGHENTSERMDYRYHDNNVVPGQIYVYRLEAVDLDGSSEYYGLSLYLTSLDKPTAYSLAPNYPNPFNPSTQISFDLPNAGLTSLRVFNLQGQLVSTLLNEDLAWGRHSVTFDASSLASGTYFYQIEAGNFKETRKMILLK